jgi:hypothetical protein
MNHLILIKIKQKGKRTILEIFIFKIIKRSAQMKDKAVKLFVYLKMKE